jgi:hypothetical protein
MEVLCGDALKDASRFEQKWYKPQDKKPWVTRIKKKLKEKKEIENGD